MDEARPTVSLRPVDAGSSQDVARLAVAPGQERFVASPAHYLAMCASEDAWQPMSMHDAGSGELVGFLMWGIDHSDGSCWLGGVLVDAAHQGRGVGRAAIVEALRALHPRDRSAGFALAYHPDNTVAKSLYASLGFVETGEMDGEEVVARLLTGT